MQVSNRTLLIDILSSMDSTDALMLDWMGTQGWHNEFGKITIKSITQNLDLNETGTKISIANLNRLGLIDLGVPTKWNNTTISVSSDETSFCLNFLGRSLLKSCQEKA